ncbi:teichoic acid biosynthesis protein C [Streptomyces sp. NPDC046805]|uniref:phage baseplate protein n=1 Tax=Streptomyces sp. NPDC046805 TaxID=3155134 RepID=UPI0033F28101
MPGPDLGAEARPWLVGARLLHSTVLQSFAFDEERGHLYALQVMQGGVRLDGEPRAFTHAERVRRGDLCLNRLSADGRLIGAMHLLGFGHGGALGVEETFGGGIVLWTEWDADPASGFGRGVCRFHFTDGRVFHRSSRGLTTFRPVPGSTHNSATVDTVTGVLLLRYKTSGRSRYRLYDLRRFTAGDFRPRVDFVQPGTDLGLPFQGVAVHGNDLYQLFGTGYGPGNAPASGGNVRLDRIDLKHPHNVRRVREMSASALRPREPEGLAALRSGGPWLCLGFTQGPSGDRAFCLYRKPIA